MTDGLHYERAFKGTFEFDSDGIVVWNPAFTFKTTIVNAAIAADRTLNLPLITATDTIAVLGLAQTFTQKQTISSSLADNSLVLTPSGNAGTSVSTGGAIRLTNTSNDGAGFILYSNAGASAAGRLMNIWADNAAFANAAFHVDYDGTANAVEIVNNSTDSSAQALNVVSHNPNDSTMGVNGEETGKGTIKIVHTGTGTDSNASGISIDLQGTGTAAQGIYVDSTASSGTTGKLLRLRNQSVDMFTVESNGVFKVSNPAATFLYSITPGAIVADRTLNIPVITGTDTLAVLGLAQTYTAVKTFDAGLNLNDNDKIQLGDAQDAAIYYDATNLIIDPKAVGSGYLSTNGGDAGFQHIGLDGTAPVSTNSIAVTTTSSVVQRVLNFTLTYQGTGASVVVVATGTWDNGSNNTNMGGGLATIRTQTVTTTSTTIYGWKASIGFTGTPAISAGTHSFNGLWVTWLGTGGTHTGGTTNRRGVFVEAFTALSGVTDNYWGGLINGDFQVNTGNKLLLEGSDTAKGDSYLIYESSSMALYADAVNTESWTSNETVMKKGWKLPRNAQSSNYTTVMTDTYIGVTSTAAARTITLIAAATAGAGKVYVIKDESGGAATNNITIDGNASETIDGATTKIINTNYGSYTIICDGSNWFTI